MGVYDFINFVVYDNPISKSVTSMVIQNKKPLPDVRVVAAEQSPLWKLASEGGPFIRIAAVMGASAVALGAYGAHRSYPKDAPELKMIFETANKYHFFHTLALMGVPMCRNPKLAGAFLISGTMIFSGALYYHALTGENKFGRLAPIGGTMLILGWLSMVV
ncbi:unnamed protein product [Ceutorhynchus assimilis]|uniref:Transmembrane protein 256 homolog n=1 Tax=Ceutorhynchus assimilis TaxID=467358 RepID=A0A9N9MWE3_9CUCU|nr:unnamed protein product [Ceutorhynchus assimilis]